MHPDRTYRIEHRRDFISGFDWRLLLTGPATGYADLQDSYGGKFFRREHAVRAGDVFVETGLLPAFQTDERVKAAREALALRVAA